MSNKLFGFQGINPASRCKSSWMLLFFRIIKKIRQIVMQIQPLKTRVKHQPFNISNRLLPNTHNHSLNFTPGTRIQCQQFSKKNMESLNNQKSHSFSLKQPDVISETTQSVLDQSLQIKSNTTNTIRNSESVPSRTYFASNSAVFTRGQFVDNSLTSSTKSNIYTVSNNIEKNSQIISNKTLEFYRPACRTSYIDLSNCQNSQLQSQNGVNSDIKYKIQTDRDNVKLTYFRLNGDSFKKQQFRHFQKCSNEKQKKKSVQTQTDKKQQGQQQKLKRVNSKKTLFLNSNTNSNGYVCTLNSNYNGMNSLTSLNIKNTQSNPTLLNLTNDKVSRLNEVMQNKVVVQKLEERKLKKQKSNKNISSHQSYQKPYVCHNSSSYNNLVNSYINQNVNKNLITSDVERIKKLHKQQVQKKEELIEKLRKQLNELRNQKELLEIRIKQYNYETGNLKRYLQQKMDSEKKLKNQLKQTINIYQNTICSINQKHQQNEVKNLSLIKNELDNFRNANRQLQAKLQQEFTRYFQLNSKFLLGQKEHKEKEVLLQLKCSQFQELQQKHEQYELKYQLEVKNHRQLQSKYLELEKKAKDEKEKLSSYFNEVSNILLYMEQNFKLLSNKEISQFHSQDMKSQAQKQDILSPCKPLSPTISSNNNNECKSASQQNQQESLEVKEKDMSQVFKLILAKLQQIKSKQVYYIKKTQQKNEYYEKQLNKLNEIKTELSIKYQKLNEQKIKMQENCSQSIAKSEEQLLMKLGQLDDEQKKREELELALQMYSDIIDATNEVVTHINAKLLNLKYESIKQSQEIFC